MTKCLADSVRAYTDRNGGRKTKQKNAQLCFAQKTLRSTKTMRMAPSKTKRRCTLGAAMTKRFFIFFLLIEHPKLLIIIKKGFVLDDKGLL